MRRFILLHRGLARKLIIYIFASIAVIFTVIFLYNYNISKKIVEKNLKSNAKNLIEKGVAQIEKMLTPIQKIPDNYSKIIEKTNYSKETLVSILEQELISNPEIYGAAIALEPYFFNDREKYFMAYYYRAGDKIELKYLLDGQYDYFTMDWYQIPKELGHPDWSEPYFDIGAGNAIMSTYSVPLYRTIDGQRQFIGILTADVALDWLEKFVDSIKVYESGYGFVISQNGTLITHPLKELMMNESIFSIAELQKSSQLREIGKNMIRGKQSFAEVEYQNIKTGEFSWIAYAPIKLNGWSIGIVFPVDELMADVNGLFSKVLLLGVSGLFFILVVIILISRSITKPLRKLSYVSKRIAEGNFEVELPNIKTRDEMKELRDSFAYMQDKLAEYVINLKETTSAREKIESELRIAHDIQMGIIPKTFPPFPDRSDVDIYGILEPAKAVGGDLYDFFMLDENHMGAAIGDVSGKGVPASLFMAVTRTLLRAKSMNMKDATPGRIVTSMNIDLCTENAAAMFVTFFYLILNLKTGELTYCNAGHNPPFIINQDGDTTALDTAHGFPLGVLEGDPYQTGTLQIQPGTRIVLYTDGVTEAENETRELFGEKRLLAVFESLKASQSPKEITLGVKSAVKEFTLEAEQSDDLTMLVIVYNG